MRVLRKTCSKPAVSLLFCINGDAELLGRALSQSAGQWDDGLGMCVWYQLYCPASDIVDSSESVSRPSPKATPWRSRSDGVFGSTPAPAPPLPSAVCAGDGVSGRRAVGGWESGSKAAGGGRAHRKGPAPPAVLRCDLAAMYKNCALCTFLEIRINAEKEYTKNISKRCASNVHMHNL